MKTSWEKTKSGHTHYCYVKPHRVWVGDHHGSGQSDNAGSCTHREFLDGQYQSLIRDVFGKKVLGEVITAVKGIGQLPEVIEKEQLENEQLDNWRKMPVEQGLIRLAAEPDEDGYRDHYGRGPNKSTVVQLTREVKIVAAGGSGKSYLVKPDGGKLEVPIWSRPMIGHGGFAYWAGDHLLILDVDAILRFDTRSMDKSHGIGGRFRITNVLRKGEVVMARYQNYFWVDDPHGVNAMGMSGLLKLDPDKGMVARCPDPVG
jgi:hypothetical protein